MEAPASGFATPATTLGMGTVTGPTDTSVGSGDTFQPVQKTKKKKKMTPLKDYLKKKKHD